MSPDIMIYDKYQLTSRERPEVLISWETPSQVMKTSVDSVSVKIIRNWLLGGDAAKLDIIKRWKGLVGLYNISAIYAIAVNEHY